MDEITPWVLKMNLSNEKDPAAKDTGGNDLPSKLDAVNYDASYGYANWADPASPAANFLAADSGDVFSLALELARPGRSSMLDAASFFQRHGADTPQGIALMMLAEALARLPDSDSVAQFLADVLPRAEWDAAEHPGTLERLAGAASRFVEWSPGGTAAKLVKAMGDKASAALASASIEGFAKAFVAGRSQADISKLASKGLWSFDMLGEAAMTEKEASAHFERYMAAIATLPPSQGNPWESSGISVKLSALDPRFDPKKTPRLLARDRLIEIAKACELKNLLLTVDAEEAERQEDTLWILGQTLQAIPKNWEGFGWAVQCNLRTAKDVIEHSLGLAKNRKSRLALRIVKGAYWDSEMRKALSNGIPAPVWPAKCYTDRSWLSAVEAATREPMAYCMMASHNPHSLAAGIAMAKRHGGEFEVQRLHGMGASSHELLSQRGLRSRSYAPIGDIHDLLPYLARRMLENGANSSILRQNANESDLGVSLANPFVKKPEILAPDAAEMFEPERANSPSLPMHGQRSREAMAAISKAAAGLLKPATDSDKASPADFALKMPKFPPPVESPQAALASAAMAFEKGMDRKASAEKLSACAKILIARRDEIAATIVAETGKRVEDAISEWREAVDFCLYHSRQASRANSHEKLPGLPGEENYLWREPRGVALCISPWNFPFAILMGQASAALAAGCPVVAKGASNASCCARLVVQCLNAAGFSAAEASAIEVPGAQMGPLIADPCIGAVAFTGSTASGRQIAVALASRAGPTARLIAETGGFNLMLVDHSAQLDAACSDILESAFNMSGQRCSSLRCVWVDRRIASKLKEKLVGALGCRKVGNPLLDPWCDYGPLIDEVSAQIAKTYLSKLVNSHGAEVIGRSGTCEGLRGSYFEPTIVTVPQDKVLREEIFAPILQFVEFYPGEEDALASPAAQGGYGLTFGLQTRMPSQAEKWARRMPAGNIYINRSMIGATVASHPFGGIGLSGTGPKIGGSGYVEAFCHEKSLSHNTAAFGGCVDLLGSGLKSIHKFF